MSACLRTHAGCEIRTISAPQHQSFTAHSGRYGPHRPVLQDARQAIARRYRSQSHSAFQLAPALAEYGCGSIVLKQQEPFMPARITAFCRSSLTALFLISAPSLSLAGSDDGIVKLKSAYAIDETIARLKQDIAAKGITFFSEIDQSKLASEAGIELRPSTLLVFGNPPLGTQFITANPNAGLDWPVRLLVFEDTKGTVWTAYTDFAWIARRHGIKDREAQFKMASTVIESITASVKAK
jgi:uncharacterized protein (DUF302 family)